MMQKWLPLDLVLEFEPLAESLGVSEVARSKRGFLTAYKEARGPKGLSEEWANKRDAFIARHMAQVEQNDEPLWEKDGLPTRRHLALIMWAYSPVGEEELETFLDDAAKALEGLRGLSAKEERICRYIRGRKGRPGQHSTVEFEVEGADGTAIYKFGIDSPWIFEKIDKQAYRSCWNALRTAESAGWPID